MNKQLQFLKKLTVLFSVALLLCFTGIKAQTLNEGDLAVIGWNALADEVHIVTLVDIPAGTVINITDRGWDGNTNAFTAPFTGDGTIIWTLSSAVPAGTVLELFLGGADDGTSLSNLTVPADLTASTVTSGYSVNDAMNIAGDQIFIYQGSDTNPFFIFGMNNSSGAVDVNNWNTSVAQALRDSELPDGTGSQNALTNGVNAIGLRTATDQQDNVQYVGPITTTDRNTWLARITNIANWAGSDADDVTNPITSTPTPIVDIAPPNNSPTDIALSNASINQSAGANAVVGTLSSTDPDGDVTFSYSLASGTGDTHNTNFNISGSSLRANNAAGLAAGTYSVRIQTDDQNGGTYQEAFTITVVDDVGPTISITSDKANLKANETATLTFTLNESSANFAAGDVGVAGGTLSGFSGSGTTYTAIFTPPDNTTATATIDVAGGTFTDAAANTNTAATQLTIAVDTEVPTVEISSNKASLKANETTTLTFTLSEASSDFTLIDLTVSDGTISGFSGTGTTYTATFTPPANATIVATIDVDAGVFTDAAGNGNTAASQLAIAVDTELPSVTIGSNKTSLTSGETATLTFTLSEASDDFELDDVTAAGGTLSAFLENSSTSYSAIFTPWDNATVTATIDVDADTFTDAAGNGNFAATQRTIAIDTSPPSGYAVTIDQVTITLANYTSLSFTFSAAEVGATFDYEITSNSGGTPVTGNGTITATGQQVSGIDVSGLANGTLTLSVTLTDASGNTGTPATDNVTKAVSYPPTITTSGGTTTFAESVSGSPVPVPIDDALTISDPDNTTLASATVAITGNFQSGQDVLAFVNDGSTMGNIGGNYSAGTLTLTSPGATATLAQWQAALRVVTYSNTSSTPNTANRTISFVVNDGLDDSTPGTKTVAVQAVNNAPVITNLDGDAVTFTEDGPAILLDAGGNATVSDSDSPDFDGGNLTVSVIAGGVGSEDMLAIRNEGMGTGQIGASVDNDVYYGGIHIGSANGGMGGADLILTFLPTATPAAVQALIRNLTYSNSNIANPSVDPRTVRVTLNDGDGATSAPSDLTVNITAVNDAPMVTTSSGAVTFTEPEDGDPVPTEIDPGLTVTDPDNATLASATISITSGSFQPGEDVLAFENDGSTMGDIDGSYDDAIGALLLTSSGASATLVEWQAALRAVTYSNNSQHPNTTTRTVSFEINDGTANSAPATKDVNVVAVNTAPVAVDDASPVNEDIPATGNVLTNDSDVEGNALTASLVTAPVNGTVVLNADGSFTYTPNSNYNGLDSLEYQVCDNGTPSLCDTAWVRFTIGAINDAPVITAPATIAVDEDVLTNLTGISFVDVDAGSADVTVTFSVASGILSATSGSGVTVGGSETGTLTMVGSVADLNTFIAASGLNFTTALNATSNVTLTVRIDDGGHTGADPGSSGTDDSESATTTITLAVNAINDAPVNTVPEEQIVDQDGVLVFSTGNGNEISISDVDVGGGTIQITLTATKGLLTLSTTMGLTFSVGGGTADGTMTFNGTIADINLALAGLIFTPASGYNGPASLQIVTDDLGLTGSGGNQTDTDVIDITVNPINPVVTSIGSTSPDGLYKISDLISLTVTFDQPVTVDEAGGSPTLLLETGDTDREAVYASGSGSNTLTFIYTVQAGDISADLDYFSTAALALNGATIRNGAGADAVLTLPAVGGAGSIAGQHALAIDGVPPVITSVDVPSNGYHVEGDPLDFTVHFSEDVTVDASGGTPYLEITIGTATVQAVYVSGSGTGALAFRYVVQAGDADLDGIVLGDDMILNGGTLRDHAGNGALLTLHNTAPTDQVFVYSVRPTVTLSTESASTVNGPFTVTAVFSEAVTGFTVDDIAVSNGTLDNFQTSDNIAYTFLVTPVVRGSVQLSVAADVAVNIADNGNDGSNTLVVRFDEIITGITLEDGSFVYDGTAKSLAVTGTLPEGTSVNYGNNSRTDVGSQEVTATISGDNYQTLELTAELTVAPLPVTVTAADRTKVFGTDDPGLTYGVIPALVAGDAFMGELVREEGEAVGGYAITQGTLSLSGNYSITFVGAELTITPASITGITLEDGSFVYDGTAKSLAVTGALPEGTSVSYGNNSRTDVGSQEVTATISGDNYEDLVLTAELTVAPLPVTVTAADRTKVFGTDDPGLTYGVIPALVAGDAFMGELVREEGEAVGGYAITQGTLSLSGNYSITFVGAELTITPASITGITLEEGSFVYDGTAKSLAVTGALPEGTSVSYGNNSRMDVGSQEVTATISGSNYETLILRAGLTVTPAERSIDFPPLPEKTYGDGAFDAGASASSGEMVSYTSSDPQVAEVNPSGRITINGTGTTTITATVPANGNYSNRPEVSRTLVVDKSSQTIEFAEVGEVHRDAGTVQLDVSASSDLPVSLSVDDPEVATVEGTALHIHRLGTVRITATQGGDDNHKAAGPVTITVRVVDPAAELPMRVSKVVSPNGDGINEYLIIEGIKDYPDNKVTVFNRNGTVLYEAKGYNNGSIAFRGVSTGQQRLPAGTYFYVAEIRINGQWKYEKGWFVLRY